MSEASEAVVTPTLPVNQDDVSEKGQDHESSVNGENAETPDPSEAGEEEADAMEEDEPEPEPEEYVINVAEGRRRPTNSLILDMAGKEDILKLDEEQVADMQVASRHQRKSDLMSATCMFVGHVGEKGKVFADPQVKTFTAKKTGSEFKRCEFLAVIVEFRDFDPEKTKNMRCSEVGIHPTKGEIPTRIQVVVRRQIGPRVRELYAEAAKPLSEEAVMELAVGDPMLIQTSAENADLLSPGCLISVDDVEVNLSMYLPKKMQPDESGAEEKKETNTYKRDPTWMDVRVFKRLNSRSFTVFPTKLDPLAYITENVPVGNNLRLTNFPYSSLLPFGPTQGSNPCGDFWWHSQWVPPVNTTNCFSFNKQPERNYKANYVEEDSKLRMIKFVADVLFYRYEPPNEGETEAQAWKRQVALRETDPSNYRARRWHLTINMWSEQCHKLLLCTRQARWMSIMPAIYPAMYGILLGNYRSDITQETDYNIGVIDGPDDGILHFSCQGIWHDLPGLLRRVGYQVDWDWVCSVLFPKGTNVDVKINTIDPDRKNLVPMLYSGDLEQEPVINLSNIALYGRFLEEQGKYEFRVLTDTWYPTGDDCEPTTVKGRDAQVSALHKIGPIPIETAKLCLQGQEEAPLKATGSTQIIYAIRR